MCDTDTAPEEIATENNFLEITAVHGTQIVGIKKEESEIVVEEEDLAIEFDAELCNDSVINQISAIPLVYTTRLDHMNTFYKIERHTPKQATEMILEESKPYYKQTALKIKPEPQNSLHVNSYIKLCSKIQELNTKAKTEAYLRNQKHLEMCKPLKIVLEDLKINKTISQPKKLLDHLLFEDYSSDENVPSSYSSDDDEPLVKLMSEKRARITVAVKDKRSQEADIYILDARKGVQNYYRTNIKECNILEQLHNSNKTILIQYCCWVKRNKRISKLIRFGLTRESISYMTKPHNCLPRPCSCCCVFGTPIVSKSNLISQNIELLLDSNSVSVPINDNNLIDKAKNYMPNVPNSGCVHACSACVPNAHAPPINNDDYVDFLKGAVVIIKYQQIIFAQTGIFGENYEIGKNGELVNFMKSTVKRSIDEEKHVFEKYDKKFNTSRIYFSYLICCWQNREDIIIRLRDENKLLPRVVQFIRSPHPCQTDRCVCCCKPRPLIHLKLGNIIAFRKRYKPSTKKQKIVPVAKNDKEKQKINRESSKSKIHTPKTNMNITKTPIGLNTQSAVQSNINSRLKHDATPINSKNNNTATKNDQFQSRGDMETSHFTSADTATTTPAVLVNSILNKFKDLKLTVKENGKLAAVVNATPDKLLNVDIKVISDILLLASGQIEQLGISPQDFCARLNASKNENNCTPLLQLVPQLNDPPAKCMLAKKGVRNMLPTTALQNNNITQKDPNGCKVQPLSPNSIPITSNKSTVCSIYQVMSCLGAQKNQHLIRAYQSHFKVVAPVESRQKRWQTSQLSDGFSQTSDKPSVIITRKACSTAKRKPPQKPYPILKKLRVKPPEELSLSDQNVSDKNQDQLLLGNKNAITIPNTSFANISHVSAGADHNLAPLISNSNFVQLQNTVDTLGPGIAQNQIPLIVTNNNFIPVQSKDIPKAAGGSVHDQIPFYVINSNFLPVNNTSGISVPQAKRPSPHGRNLKPFFVSNGKILPIQNKSGNLLQSTGGSFNDQKPFFVTNSNLTPAQNVSGTHVDQLEVGANTNKKVVTTNSQLALLPLKDTNNAMVPQPTIINNDYTIVDNSNQDSVIENIISDSDDLPPVTETDNEAPLVSNSHSLPMQNIIDAVVSNVANQPIKASTGPAVNPLLYQILTKARASPSLPRKPRKQRLPSLSPPKSHLKSCAKPLILKHSHKKPFRKQTRNNIKNKTPEVTPLLVISSDDSDIASDFESSIKSTVIKCVKPAKFTEEEILDAVNNKQLIASGSDEEESIFGV